MHGVAIAALAVGLALGLSGHAAGASPARGDDMDVAAAAPVAPGAMTGSIRRAMQQVAIADTDYDGRITRAEASVFFERSFMLLDRDRDGALSENEVVAARGLSGTAGPGMRGFGQGRAPEFEGLDLDGDGTLSREEFIRGGYLRQAGGRAPTAHEHRLRLFRALDGDADGLVPREQFLSFGARHFASGSQDGDGSMSVWSFLAPLGL